MAIIASAKGTGATPVSEGVHTAVCIWVIDIGDQYSEMYGNSRHKVMITWEIPDETILVDGEEKPRVISKEYTLSLSEKAVLRQHLESWRSRKFSQDELNNFDLVNILGKSCQLQILHNSKGYAGVGTVMALPKGMPPLSPIADTIYFDLTDVNSLDIMGRLPAWIQDKIKQSDMYKKLARAAVDSEGGDFQEVDESGDPLPF